MLVLHSDTVSKNLSVVKANQGTVGNGVWDTTHLLPRFAQNYDVDSTYSVVNRINISDMDS